MATTYKVSYFPSKGNAEIMRLLFAVKGVTFEDERLTREQWLAVKEKSPTKQMPLLTITTNGKERVIGQSGACSRYLARKFGLFGKSPEDELLVDEVYESVMDAQREIYKIVFEKDETKKTELIKNVKEGSLPRLNDYIKLRVGKNESGFIIGDSMTLADLQLYNLVDQASSMINDLFSQCPVLQKHADFVKAKPEVAEWTAKTQQKKQ